MRELRPPEAPYPGLRAYEERESALFVGREGQVGVILDLLARYRLAAVTGASGCGKSSLVRAGIMPELLKGSIEALGGFWTIAYFRPGDAPLHNLGSALLQELETDDPSAMRQKLDRAFRSSDGLRAVRREFRAQLRLDPALKRLSPVELEEVRGRINLLVIADQFEEIFNEYNRGSLAAEELVDCLTSVYRPGVRSPPKEWQPEERVFVLLTMRSEYLGQCAAFLQVPEILNAATYFVRRLNGRELEQVASRPLSSFVSPTRRQPPTVVLVPDIHQQLLDEAYELRHDPDHLPLFQHALARLWWLAVSSAAPRQKEVTVDKAAVERALELPSGQRYAPQETSEADGKLLGRLLAAHSEQVFASLSPDERRIAEIMLRRLVDTEPSGTVVRRLDTLAGVAAVVTGGAAAEADQAAVRAVAEKLAADEHRFIQTRPADGELAERLDIAHEALIRKWPRYRDWAREEARAAREYLRLHDEAAGWAAAPAEERGTELLIGSALLRALEWRRGTSSWQPSEPWAQRYGGDFATVVRFVEESEKAAEYRKQAKKEREEEAARQRQEMLAAQRDAANARAEALAAESMAANARARAHAAELESGRVRAEKDWLEERSRRLRLAKYGLAFGVVACLAIVGVILNFLSQANAQRQLGDILLAASEVQRIEANLLSLPAEAPTRSGRAARQAQNAIRGLVKQPELGDKLDDQKKPLSKLERRSQRIWNRLWWDKSINKRLKSAQDELKNAFDTIVQSENAMRQTLLSAAQQLPRPLYGGIDLPDPPVALDLTDDGRRAAVAFANGELRVFRVGSAQASEWHVTSSGQKKYYGLRLSPDGSVLAAVSLDGLELWRLGAKAEPLLTEPRPLAPFIVDFTFDPQGDRLAMIGLKGDFAILKIDERGVMMESGKPGQPESSTASNAGNLITTAVGWIRDGFCALRFDKDARETRRIQLVRLPDAGATQGPCAGAELAVEIAGGVSELPWPPPYSSQPSVAWLFADTGRLVVIASDNSVRCWSLDDPAMAYDPVFTTGSVNQSSVSEAVVQTKVTPASLVVDSRGYVLFQLTDGGRSISQWSLPTSPYTPEPDLSGDNAPRKGAALDPTHHLLADFAFKEPVRFFEPLSDGSRIATATEKKLQLWEVGTAGGMEHWPNNRLRAEGCLRAGTAIELSEDVAGSCRQPPRASRSEHGGDP